MGQDDTLGRAAMSHHVWVQCLSVEIEFFTHREVE